MNTQRPPLIGLTGLAGSGKDTVRGLLVRHHGYTGLALADPIRAMLRALLAHVGQGDGWMSERERKEQPVPAIGASYRQLAQTLGTEWGRAIDPGLWLRLAEARMALMREALRMDADDCFVISDVRFPNEADWVRRLGGQVWRVHRPGVEPVRAHASESSIEQIGVDRTVRNTGTLLALEAEVQRLMAGEVASGEAQECCCDNELTLQEIDTGKCQACGREILA